MPYNKVEDIDARVRKVLPHSGQKMYMEVFNQSYTKHKSDSKAARIAWGVVKKHFRKEGDKWIALSESFIPRILYTFNLDTPKELFVTNAEDGTIVMEAVLADTTNNTDGKYFSEEDLHKLAEQINTDGSTLPDVEHSVLDGLLDKFHYDVELVKNALREVKGIFKSIKAVVDKGKLWIRAILDKRYKNHVDKYKGLSIEAVASNDGSNRLKNPVYLGFTFTQTPKLVSAQIAR